MERQEVLFDSTKGTTETVEFEVLSILMEKYGDELVDI